MKISSIFRRDRRILLKWSILQPKDIKHEQLLERQPKKIFQLIDSFIFFNLVSCN